MLEGELRDLDALHNASGGRQDYVCYHFARAFDIIFTGQDFENLRAALHQALMAKVCFCLVELIAGIKLNRLKDEIAARLIEAEEHASIYKVLSQR